MAIIVVTSDEIAERSNLEPILTNLRTLVLLVLPTAVTGVAASDAAAAYGWPVRPFHRQHVVSGNFGDPRGDNFHHGVDIRARDGTPVYATITGTVVPVNDSGEVVGVSNARRTLSYWHIVPTVREGDRAVAYRTIVGRIERGAGHVHLAEQRRGVYVNPLRPRALTPYDDATGPTIRTISVHRGPRRISSLGVSGTVSVIADVLDWPSLPVELPRAERHLRVAPALVRWRLTRGRRVVVPWKTAADFRRRIPPQERYAATYAPGSQPNWRRHSGRYRFYLLRGWDSRSVRDGNHTISVLVSDVRGNIGTASLRLRVRN